MKKVETTKRQSAKAAAPETTAVSKAEDVLLNAIIVKEGTDKDSPFYKKPITTSLLVAKKFGKEHRNVTASIKELLRYAENSAHLSDGNLTSAQNWTDLSGGDLRSAENWTDLFKMFEAVKLPDSYGRMQPAYIMNKDGFTLLAMSFTGEQALQFKLDYIAEFNRRADMIIALEKRVFSDTLERSNLLLETLSNENNEYKDYIRHQPSLPISTYAEAKQNFQDTVTLLSSIDIANPQLKSKSEKLKHFYQGCDNAITPEVLAHESENKVYKQKLLNE